MPDIESDGARIWYTIDGRDDAPALLLLHSLGTSHALWDEQLPPLVDRYRLIRYDARGHGKSTAPPGEFTIEQLGRDALAVLDAAGAKSAVVCGVSIGGLTEHLARPVRTRARFQAGAREHCCAHRHRPRDGVSACAWCARRG